MYYSISKNKQFVVFVFLALCYTTEKKLWKTTNHIVSKKEEWQKGTFGSFKKQVTYQRWLLIFYVSVMPIFLSLLLRFISDIISHENRLFNIILYYVCNRILWSFVKRFICERVTFPSEYSKKDLALLNLLTVLLKYDPCWKFTKPSFLN